MAASMQGGGGYLIVLTTMKTIYINLEHLNAVLIQALAITPVYFCKVFKVCVKGAGESASKRINWGLIKSCLDNNKGFCSLCVTKTG